MVGTNRFNKFHLLIPNALTNGSGQNSPSNPQANHMSTNKCPTLHDQYSENSKDGDNHEI